MSQFQSVRCDECGRIQDGANHWMTMRVWSGMAVLGESHLVYDINGRVQVFDIHDLCGQGCAMKHIAKLLGWNVSAEQATREERG